MYEDLNYDPSKCDLWAIGVIIYKLKYNQIPLIEFYRNIVPKKFDNELLDDLVRKLIIVEQNKRINWKDYFNHPFFKTNDNQKISIFICDSRGERNKIEIDKFSYVSDLIKIIKEKKNIFENINVIFNGLVLEENQIIDECGIENFSYLDYVGVFVGG